MNPPALAHIVWPELKIDAITIALLVIATLPWLAPLVKSIELPGGWKLEFAQISKQLIEKTISATEKEKLTRQQVVAEHSWDSGYYKLYSNGVLTQRFKAKIIAGREQSDLTLPITFPNEVTNIEVIGDLAVKVTDLSASKVQLRYQPQSIDREVTIILSGL